MITVGADRKTRAHSAYASGHKAMIKRTRAMDPMPLLAGAALATLVALSFGSLSYAQTRLWYYRSTTHEFYPYTQNCSVPSRGVHPYNAVPLGQAQNVAPQQEQSGSEGHRETQAAAPPTLLDEASPPEAQIKYAAAI